MDIERITVLKNDGADVMILHTNLPSGIFPFTGTAELKLTVAKSTCEEYIKKHFPDIPCIIKSI